MTNALFAIGMGWTAFIGSHVFLSSKPVRKSIIETVGKPAFLGLYSATAFGTLALPISAYILRGRTLGPRLFQPFKYASKGVLLIGSIIMGNSFFTPNLEPPNPNKVTCDNEKRMIPVTGVLRITRHPLFASLGVIGIGNAVSSGLAGPVMFWLGFPLTFVIGCLHQDSRLREEIHEYYYEKTSLLPFYAILQRRNSLELALSEFTTKGWVFSGAIFAFLNFI
jgi:uncharacterized membrane protein